MTLAAEPEAGGKVRDLLAAAILAGRHGRPLGARLAERVRDPAGDLRIEELGFDSLAWMEFCIAIELASGVEIHPADISRMRRLSDIATWITRQN